MQVLGIDRDRCRDYIRYLSSYFNIYYNDIYSIPAKSRGIMTIPAEPGPGQNRLILAGTGIWPGIPVDP